MIRFRIILGIEFLRKLTGLSATAESDELVGDHQSQDQYEAVCESFLPFFSGDLPLLTEVNDVAVRLEGHARFYVFHQRLGGKAAAGFERKTAYDHGLIAKGDTSEYNTQFVESFDEKSGEGRGKKALPENEHGGLGVLVDGLLKVLMPAIGVVCIGVSDEDPITGSRSDTGGDLLASSGW